MWSKIRPLVGLLCVEAVLFYARAEFHGSWPFLQGGFFGEVWFGVWSMVVGPCLSRLLSCKARGGF